MKIQKSKSFVLTSILLVSLLVLIQPSYGVSPLNIKCPTVGKSTIKSGITYICSKKGSGLVWTILPPKNAATSDAKLESIFNTLKEKMAKSAPHFDWTVHVDPLLDNSQWSKDSLSSIQSAEKLFNALGVVPARPLNMYISWGTDFLKSEVPECLGANPAGPGGSCGQGKIVANLNYFATNWGYGGIEKPYKSEMDKFIISANIPHEIGHFAQEQAAESAGNTDFWMYQPPWLREGGAEYFKFLSYGYDQKTTYKHLHDLYVASGAQRCLKYPLLSISNPDSAADGCEFSEGIFAVEYLVIKVGNPDAIFRMAKAKGSDAAERFQNAYGFSLASFAVEADAYFASLYLKK